MEAAEHEFCSAGYDATSLRAIIASSGYALGTFYNYFDDKEAVFRAVIERRVGESRRQIRKRRLAASTFAEFVEAHFRWFFFHVIQDPAAFELLQQNIGAIRKIFAYPKMVAGLTDTREDLAALVAKGWVASVDVELVSASMWSVALELGSLMVKRSPPDPDAMTRFATNLFVNGAASHTGLKAPPPAMIETSSGKLHPEVAQWLAAQAQAAPPLFSVGVGTARAFSAGLAAMLAPGPELHAVWDEQISGAAPIGVRIYEPSPSPTGVLVYCHGGGWVVGSVDEWDPFCRELSAASGARIVSVEYRLAPEHPFPAAPDDAFAALAWAAARWPDTPLAVGGDSAGGALAASAAMRARSEGIDLTLQVLIYPVLDSATTNASYARHGAGPFLTTADMQWFWSLYTPDESLRLHPHASPLRTPDISAAPPLLLVSAEIDPLLDEGRTYAARLAEAGVAVEDLHFPGMMHGFAPLVSLFSEARRAVDLIAQRLRTAFTAA